MDKSFQPEQSAVPVRKTATAYIALGSNIGDRSMMLASALQLLDGAEGVEVMQVSSVYETDPVGYADQPAFLNMTAALSTALEPLELLRLLLKLELELGRVREFRNGPRVIDLDLLLVDDVSLSLPELELPHPRMLDRAFVMVPLSEVLEKGHPLLEQAKAMAGAALRDGKEGIVLWNTINWRSASAPFGS
ncbi:2-amino-4-hydroxy-6-hydroxymethyldihydropteridine diphosphokinase [Paenibacillus pasadenensis]|nr:2-amino-4-hydroxy-6-hydroxymethyldihydropteridine diphosphokinase [Paenibacillus pasadenensis]MCM3750099.1 2-amino-4-hydroxy-6-hydroxymethyldihydropteridine diphosphokinase [Paenibacillus pasadenensis]